MDKLKTYIKALAAAKSKDLSSAEKLLLQSLDLDNPTPYMQECLSKLVDLDNPNDAVLTLVTREKIKG